MKTKLSLFVTVLAAALFGVGCATTESTFVKEGLVAYYPFNGNAKDESGNRNHAENKGTLPAEDRHGVKGKAMSIGDANKDAVVNLGKVMAGKTTYSISIWFRTDDVNGGVLLMTEKLYTSGAISFWVTDWFAEWGYYVSGNYLAVGTRNKGQRLNNRYNKRWDHVVLTVADEGKEKISFYLNGRLVTKEGPDLELRKILNEDLLLGNHPPHKKDEHFHGSFDDLRLYDRALSKDEVKALYDLEKPKKQLSFPSTTRSSQVNHQSR